VKSELGGTAASVDIEVNIEAIVGRGVAGRMRRATLSVVAGLTLAAALLAPAAANAVEPTSGYTVPKTEEPTSGYTVPAKEPPKAEAPKPEPPKPPLLTPKTGSSPSKESEKPLVEEGHGGVLPENERLAGEAPAKASALPFTGLDLRWELGFGVLLLATGLGLVEAQHRRERVHQR
jgi:hypothetical protein